MKFSEQGRIAASMSNQILGMSRRNIAYKEKGLIVPLYKAIVSPHLEYCIRVILKLWDRFAIFVSSGFKSRFKHLTHIYLVN